MFSSTGLFKDVQCPVEAEGCTLLTCPFFHNEDASQRLWHQMPTNDNYLEPVPKRQKVLPKTSQNLDSQSDFLVKARSNAFVGSLVTRHRAGSVQPDEGEVDSEETKSESEIDAADITIPRSATRAISPPPLRSARIENGQGSLSHPKPQESLNPRMLQKDPAGYQARLLYLKKLHEGMARLNREMIKSDDVATQQLALTPGELVTVALDEEEKIAKDNPSVYANVIKLRMVAYKKMALEEWKQIRLEARNEQDSSHLGKIVVNGSTVTRSRPLNSELSPAQEVEIARKLIVDLSGLQQFGYTLVPPSEADLVKVAEGLEAAKGWEQCERCKTRFQVYPDRRADGVLTSGGRCIYHWGRIARPKRDRTEAITGPKETVYGCCNETIGLSQGCVTADTHVFKVYDSKRLASVLQYERTPKNPNVTPNQAVAFDCEMGYTTKGFELIRLTAISFPEGKNLIDVLVRPLGTLIDLNSRWSGVWPEEFMNAISWDEEYQSNFQHTIPATNNTVTNREPPRIVDSPMAARSLLFRFISPDTPLIGHGIENDLNAARLVHPSIIDTTALYPHPRGMPYRLGLKALVRQYLWRDIQLEGASGHDSKEDAQATADLVRLRVIRDWLKMRKDGWTLDQGSLKEPVQGIQGTPKGPRALQERQTGQKRPLPLDYC